MKFALTLSLIFAVSTPAYAYSDSEANLRLGRHLTTIEDAAHRQRLIGGVSMLVLGAAGGVGFFLARNSTDADTRDTIAPIVGIAGGVFLVTGTLALLIPGDNETLPQKFKTTPDSDLKVKVSMGEDILRQLAKRAKRERLIGAGTGAAIGLGQIIWYAADSGSPTRDRSWLLYNGAIVAGLSAVAFFVPRQEEEEYEAYQEWRGDKRTNLTPQAGIVATLGVPTPALLWRF